MTDALLLDTCALLWLASGSKSLSRGTRSLIADAGVVYVSPVSAWEIAVKVSKGKIILPLEARQWFEAIVKKYEIEVLKMSYDDMLLSAELPWHHKDPADRFIIATALKNGLTVVTADGNFKKYGVTTIC